MQQNSGKEDSPRCSFCGNTLDGRRKRMAKGRAADVYICDVCAELLHELMKDKNEEEKASTAERKAKKVK